MLPKGVRWSSKSRRFGAALKSIMGDTSELRDLDTLIETLELHRANLPEEFIAGLQNLRAVAAGRARVAKKLLAARPPPKLRKTDVGKKKLPRRLTGRAQKSSRLVAVLLKKVKEDESKAKELHALRKEVKKLRYLLELADVAPPELPVLSRWQESLGAIHDLDVAVAFMQNSNIESRERAIGELQGVPHQNYVSFTNEYEKDLMKIRGGILADVPLPLPN